MHKFKMILTVFALLVVTAFSQNKYVEGVEREWNSLKAYAPQQNHYVSNCSTKNDTIAAAYKNCRYVQCDSSGIIKISYTDQGGVSRTEVKYLFAGEAWWVSNVTMVYRYYVGSTPCTAMSYTDAGSLVTGIKLRY